MLTVDPWTSKWATTLVPDGDWRSDPSMFAHVRVISEYDDAGDYFRYPFSNSPTPLESQKHSLKRLPLSELASVLQSIIQLPLKAFFNLVLVRGHGNSNTEINPRLHCWPTSLSLVWLTQLTPGGTASKT